MEEKLFAKKESGITWHHHSECIAFTSNNLQKFASLVVNGLAALMGRSGGLMIMGCYVNGKSFIKLLVM